MCTKTELNHILNEFTTSSRVVFGEKLKDILLFGSYARGDYHDASDIDLLLLADVQESELAAYRKKVADYTADISLSHDILLSPIIEPLERYERYKQVIPFLVNIQKEGISIGI